jgi:hypothetical protein
VTFFLHFCSNSNNAGLGNCSCACSGFSELAGAKLKGKPSTVAVDFGKLYSILGRTAIGTFIVLAIALLPSESSCWWTEFFRFFVDVFKDTELLRATLEGSCGPDGESKSVIVFSDGAPAIANAIATVMSNAHHFRDFSHVRVGRLCS